MVPLWDVAIAPVIAASEARRVVEIGALRGETTVRLLEHLGSDGEVYVIDPAPRFDPGEHERAWPSGYHFFRDVSHLVLPTLPAMDVALIDGDHNWYTVIHELRMLAAAARSSGAPLPVLILHDVGWPYGRRDMYHAPDRIPSEFRRPHRQAGMRPGRRHLVERGGLNSAMHNAETEGGERNGVMTALDDFLAGHDEPTRLVHLPISFGLAIVADRTRLDASPALAEVLDHLESAAGRGELMELAEDIRLRATVVEHTVKADRDRQVEHATDLGRRYLDLLEQILCDEETGRGDEAAGADRRHVAEAHRRRLRHLRECIETVIAEGVPGDLLVAASASTYVRAILFAHAITDRVVWVAAAAEPAVGDPDRRAELARHGLLDDRVRFVDGRREDALAGPIERLAILHLDGQMDESTRDAMPALESRVATGGFVLVDDDPRAPECADATGT